MDDIISRKAAIAELDHAAWGKEYDKALAKTMLESLPTAQPEKRTEKHTETHTCDLISRQAAIDAFDGLPNCPNGYSDTYDKACIIGVLEDLPSAQTEIIRCKDCKYWLKTTLSTVDGEPVYDCPLLNEWGDEDGFCSFAERKDNG